jgi:pyrimidine deaminase RibD-like protein
MSLATQDRVSLKQALDEARKCIPNPTAYCVGCVIVDPATQKVLSTGFSRELSGNTHAEECALAKLQTQTPDVATEDAESRRLVGLDMYATMEPCSERLSGNKSCTDRILENGGLIGRVVLGVREPDTFVKCVGVEKLLAHGVVVVRNDDEELERECLEVARRGH